jgi:glycosidase
MLLTLPGLPRRGKRRRVRAHNDLSPLPRSDPYGLRSWYAQLIALRHTYAALHSSNLEFVELGSANEVLAYIRRAPNGADDLLVVLNYGGKSAKSRCRGNSRCAVYET